MQQHLLLLLSYYQYYSPIFRLKLPSSSPTMISCILYSNNICLTVFFLSKSYCLLVQEKNGIFMSHFSTRGRFVFELQTNQILYLLLFVIFFLKQIFIFTCLILHLSLISYQILLVHFDTSTKGNIFNLLYCQLINFEKMFNFLKI